MFKNQGTLLVLLSLLGGFLIGLQSDIINFNQSKMIEKARVYPEFQYSPQKYQIDYFHNPYLAKLNLKLTPRPNVATYQLLSPLSLQNNIQVSQSIPLYKNQKVKLALIWRQYITHKYARAHFGLSVQYKIYEELRIKTRAMVGITSLLDLEIARKINSSLVGFVGYSGLLQNHNLFSSVNVGLRKGPFVAYLTNKMNNQTQVTLAASRQITEGIYAEATYNCRIDDSKKGQVQINLNQRIDGKSSALVGIVGTPYYNELNFKVQYERLLTKAEKMVVSTEYSEGRTVFYIGFKNLNFNFVFPFYSIDGAVPVILGAIAFGAGYLYKRYAGQKYKGTQVSNVISIEDSLKTQEKRQQELQVISDKAADQYEKEKLNRRGLRIEEAYVGPAGQLEEFMNDPQRHVLILRNNEYKQKFVDLTVTMRFYVMKGQLKLRKGQKDSLLGFYRKKGEHNRIGIRYIKNEEVKTQFFDYLDGIIIANEA